MDLEKFYQHLFHRTAPVAASENSVITISLTTLGIAVRFPWTWISTIILEIESDKW